MTSRTAARVGLLAGLLLVLSTTACGGRVASPAPGPAPLGRTDLVPDDHPGPFEVTGFVLQDETHGPQLCAGAIALSLPPRCGGPDLLGWAADALPAGSYEPVGRSRYGTFVLTGVPEGGAFRLTAPPRAAGPGDRRATPEPSFATPCPEPAGGWRTVDPARTGDEALSAALVRATALEGYGASWVDPSSHVLTVTTTGDLAAAESAVRAVWGGPLCVGPAARSEAELTAARDALDRRTATSPLLDLQLDPLAGRVTATALLARDADQRRLDAEFGVGVVRLSSLLRVPAP